MPWAPKKPCTHPGCRELVTRGERHCEAHRKERQNAETARRGPGSRAFYKSAAWLKARAAYLARHPVCQADAGCDEPATEVDHIVEMSAGGAALDDANFVGLCKPHHSQKTARQANAFGGRRGGHRAPR